MDIEDPVAYNMTVRDILNDVEEKNPTVGILRLPSFCLDDPLECFFIFTEILLDTLQDIEDVFQPEEHFTVGGMAKSNNILYSL